MSSIPPAPKELHGGRYVLVAPLGQGAQGTTWDAVDKREGRAVAIKAFDVRGARAWKDVELAEREAKVLSTLDHPLLPRYVEHFETDGVLYLVMEKVEGTPLSVLQKQGPAMTEDDVTRFLHDADRVLTYLHDRPVPVIHRDIKPSNVIQRPDGSFAFVDFGSVRDHLRAEGGSTVVGTFGYMAPEQFQGRAGPETDIYAVGATAISLLTATEPDKLPHRGLEVDLDAALRGQRGSRLRTALGAMLQSDPDKRAKRIAPLLSRTSRTPPRSTRPPVNAWSHQGQAFEDMGRRHAARAARRAAKQARKLARRAGRRPGHFRLPFFVRLPIFFALTIARLAVALALGVVVPLALTLLSILFGEPLRRAAQAVRGAGGQALDTLGDARTQVREGWGPPEAEPVRIEVREVEPRVRVATEPRHEEMWDEETEEDEAEEAGERQRARRRV